MLLYLFCDKLLDVVVVGGDVVVFVLTTNRLGKLCCELSVLDECIAFAGIGKKLLLCLELC